MRKKINWTSVTLELICYAYIILMLYASIYKLLDVGYFTRQLEKSPMIGEFSGLLAFLVPGVELVIAGMLLYGPWRRTGLLFGGALMLAFTVYIGLVLGFSSKVPCACGGIFVSMGWGEHMAFNAGFVALAGIGLWLMGRERKMKNT